MFFSVYSNRCLLPTRLNPKIAGKAVLKQKHLKLKTKNKNSFFEPAYLQGQSAYDVS